MTLGIHFSYSLGSKIRLLKLYGENSGGSSVAFLPERNMRRNSFIVGRDREMRKRLVFPGLLQNSVYILRLSSLGKARKL